MFRNVTLKCLTEIAGVSVNQYEEQFVNLFTLTMCQLKQVHTHTNTHHYVTQCKHFSEKCVIPTVLMGNAAESCRGKFQKEGGVEVLVWLGLIFVLRISLGHNFTLSTAIRFQHLQIGSL